MERALNYSLRSDSSQGRRSSLQKVATVRLVEPPAHDGDLVAMCMMSVGSQCGGCVCGCCVCDVHAWMPCRLGHGRACGATGRLKFSDLVPTRNGCRPLALSRPTEHLVRGGGVRSDHPWFLPGRYRS